MNAVAISESATGLLLRRLAGERVEVTVETRPLYRELAAAGLMIALHTPTGRESAFRLTEGIRHLPLHPRSIFRSISLAAWRSSVASSLHGDISAMMGHRAGRRF